MSDDPHATAAGGDSIPDHLLDPPPKREVLEALMADPWLQDAVLDDDAFVRQMEKQLQLQENQDPFPAQVAAAHQQQGRGRWLPWSLTALAALIAIWALLRTPSTNPIPQAPTATSGVIALLVDDAGACFADQAGPDDVRFGTGHYKLEAGAARLRFANGSDVIVQAPARFDISDGFHVALHEGRMRSIIPESGHGFTITAPDARFEDLGTEFGVAIHPDGGSDLHVFSGAVNIRPLQEDSILVEGQMGQAFSLENERIVERFAAEPDAFIQPADLGYLRWKTTRSAHLQTAGLLWSIDFEAEETTAVSNTVHGARPVSGRWPSKQGLLFDRSEDHLAITWTGSYEVVTLAAWVKVDRFDQPLHSLLDSNGWEPGDLHWQIDRSGVVTLSANVPGESQTKRISHHSVQANEWTHIVSTLDVRSGYGQTWINGQIATEQQIPPSRVASINPGSCQIGNWERAPSWPHAPLRRFCGRIDEIAAWNRTLTDDERTALILNGRPNALWNIDE